MTDAPSDPRDRQIADLHAQLRLLAAQADALRAELEHRETEITRLSALLIEAQDAAAAPPPGLLARLTGRR